MKSQISILRKQIWLVCISTLNEKHKKYMIFHLNVELNKQIRLYKKSYNGMLVTALQKHYSFK